MPHLVLLSVALLTLLCAPPVQAQQEDAVGLRLDPDVALTQYVHDHWGTNEGLPQSSVSALLQTRDGYLWAGTQEGLTRFNGVSFDPNYKADTTSVLHGSIIHDIVQARDGSIWAATTPNGVVRLHEETVTAYGRNDGLGSLQALAVFEDSEGTIWVGTDGGGLHRFDGERFSAITTRDGLAGDDVLAIAEGPEGHLWVGTEQGLSHFHRKVIHNFSHTRGLPGNVVRALHVDDDGTVWAGTDGGLAVLRGKEIVATYTPEDGLPAASITSLLRDASGTLWIGTRGGGLAAFRDGTFDTFTEADGLSYNVVRSLLQDHEGSLWVGTDGGGLNRLYQGKFIPYTTAEGLSRDVAFAVTQDAQGRMWVGTEGGGLSVIEDGAARPYTEALQDAFVLALHADADSTLWAGIFGGGLCHVLPEGARCLTTDDGLRTDNVFSVTRWRGDIWFGTTAGLHVLRDDGTIEVLTVEDGLSSESIRTLHVDAQDRLWIATNGGGVQVYDGSSFTTYRKGELSSDFPLAFYEEPAGTVWAGMLSGGVCRFPPGGEPRCFTTADGLHNDNVVQLLSDELGYLWIGTLRGIARVPLSHFDAVAAGERETVVPTIYGTHDGLESAELNGATHPTAWRSRDGRLWFSTVQGVAVVDPNDIPINEVPPPVHIEEVELNNAPVAGDEELRVEPGRRDLAFQYAGLSFIAPEHMAYAYQLEGYDEGWVDAETRRDAYYTNLPPGRYTFRVRARNADGVWNESGAAYSFYVAPFFHETGGFWLLVALSILGIGLIGHRYRLNRLHHRAEELDRKVREQTQELREREAALAEANEGLADLAGSLQRQVREQVDAHVRERAEYERQLLRAKDEAEASSRLKSAILHNMSHEIRTPITAILGSADILSEEVHGPMEEFVAYIRQSGQRLLATLSSVLDLSRMETETFRPHVSQFDLAALVRETVGVMKPVAQVKDLAVRADLPDGSLDVHQDEQALSRVLDNLVGNAIKFTDSGEVVVRAEAEGDDFVCIEVRDTGCGISEEFLPRLFEAFQQESDGLARSHEGSGLGLAITERLVEVLGGSIAVESEVGAGSTFTVRLPRRVPGEAGDGTYSHDLPSDEDFLHHARLLSSRPRNGRTRDQE